MLHLMLAGGQGSLCVAVLWGPQSTIQDAQLALGASFYPARGKTNPKSSSFLHPFVQYSVVGSLSFLLANACCVET